jgi:trimethylamine--corrinoid protein Co-methyltransferase
MQELSPKELNRIHDASMNILQNAGVAFHGHEALEIFKKHGFKVDGRKVHFHEGEITRALYNAPSNFTLSARNSSNDIHVGLDEFYFIPGYGAVFIAMPGGEQRKATLEDYDNFCKLTQTSKHIDMNGFLMVTPSDVPSETAHLDMIYSNITLCDKVFMGSSQSGAAARDTLEMAAIAWGGKDAIEDKVVMLCTMSGTAPLQWSGEMAGALIEYAKHGQLCAVRGSGLRGASMPITLAGSLVVQNATTLAALTLAQLVNPGTPVAYGGAPLPLNMKTGEMASGLPEYSMSISAVAQLARFYGIPSRENGAVTDAHLPDYQAGAESALLLATCVRNGVNLNLTSCGMLSSFMAMSFEKFLLDEELCGMIRKLVKHEEVTEDSIGLDEIMEVGIGGAYLDTPRTIAKCRSEFFMHDVMNDKSHDAWKVCGMKRIDSIATNAYRQRLEIYQKPEIGNDIEKDLLRFLTERKGG